MFGGHCERRARSTGRLHNARAKSVGEDHTILFLDSDFVASSQTARKKIDEKAFGNRQNPRRMAPKSPKKSISGRLGRPKRFRGRVWTCSGRFLDTQMLPQSRSWVAPDDPRAVKSCPKARRGIPDTLQVPSGQLSRRSQGRSRRQTQSQALPDRFWSDFRSTRGNSEVHFVLVFTVFF